MTLPRKLFLSLLVGALVCILGLAGSHFAPSSRLADIDPLQDGAHPNLDPDGERASEVA